MAFNLSPFTMLREQISVSSDMPEEVQVVEHFMKSMSPIHEAYQRQWYLNISNYIGNQWIVFDRVSRRFITPPAPSWRVRLTINKLLPIGRTQMAKLAEINPSFYVASRTPDDQDVNGARIATKLVESIYNADSFQDETLDSIRHFMVLTGNAFVFPFYDPDAGREVNDSRIVPIIDPATGQPAIDPNTGQPLMREEEFKFSTGDLDFDFVDPFEFIPDFSTVKWSEQSAVIKRKLRSTRYIMEKYGVKVSPEGFDLQYSNPQKLMAQVNSTGVSPDITQTMKHAVSVKDYYEAPTSRHKKGRHIIIAGGKLLHSDRLPDVMLDGKLKLPFVPFQGIKVPRRLLAMSPLENILPLQWQYNRGRSQIIEDINLMSRPKWVAPYDSIADDVITDQPGEVVLFDPAAGDAPRIQAGAQTVDSGRIDNLNRLDQEMQDIGGVNTEVGRLPRRATSGFALSLLEEKDTTVIAPMKFRLRKGLERLFSMGLNIAGKRFKETRILKLLSDRQKTEFIKFSATDLNSNDDLRILSEEAFPQGRMAKLEFVTELMKIGMISAQSGRKILSLDGFTNVDELIGDDESRRIAAEQAAQEQVGGGQTGDPNLTEESIAQQVTDQLKNQGQ